MVVNTGPRCKLENTLKKIENLFKKKAILKKHLEVKPKTAVKYPNDKIGQILSPEPDLKCTPCVRFF